MPQAVCSRYGLSIGGHAAPVVRLLMWMTAPISWPIGKGLDWMLGKEQPVFGKRQISALVDLHRCAHVSAHQLVAGEALQRMQPGKSRLWMGTPAPVRLGRNWGSARRAAAGRQTTSVPVAGCACCRQAWRGRGRGRRVWGARAAGPAVCRALRRRSSLAERSEARIPCLCCSFFRSLVRHCIPCLCCCVGCCCVRRESAGMGGPLNEEEAHVIQGVLDLSSKTGSKAMTPLDKVCV